MNDRDPDHSSPAWAPALWILALSLIAGLVDFYLGVKEAARGFSPIYIGEYGFPVVGLVALSTAAALAVLWLLIGWPLARFRGAKRLPMVLGFLVGLGTVGYFADGTDPFKTHDLGRTAVDLTRLAFAGIFPGLVAYKLFARGGSAARKRLETWVFGITVGLTGLTAIYWAVRYLPGAEVSGLWWAFVAVGVLVLAVGTKLLGRSRGWMIPALFAGLLLAPVLPWPDNGLAIPERTNAGRPGGKVLLLTVDTLRADALTPYGAAPDWTPNLERFAGDSVLFESPTSAGNWTLPGTASLLTGLSVSVHEVKELQMPLSESIDTLAEHLSRAGMVTAGIGGNPHLSSAELQFDQGFDRYYFLPMGYGGSMGGKVYNWLHYNERTTGPSTRLMTRQAIDWLRANHDRDFFLWLHYFDPHLGYEPPPEYMPEGEATGRIQDQVSVHNLRRIRAGSFTPNREERARIRDLYEAEVRLVDDGVGAVLDELRALGIYDEMTIVFSSDHGEELFDHGGLEHGHTVYEEVTAVPLIIKGPGSALPAGLRVAEPVSTEGVVPTILDLVGMEVDPVRFTGLNLNELARSAASRPESSGEEADAETSDLAQGEGGDEASQVEIDAAPSPIIVSQGALYYRPQISVRMGRYKFIVDLIGGVEELYDLETDPEERHSLVRDLPEVVEEAKRALAAHEEYAKKLQKTLDIEIQGIELTDETIEQLRSLGYM